MCSVQTKYWVWREKKEDKDGKHLDTEAPDA